MTLDDTQPAAKLTRKRKKSTPEKRQSTAQRVQRHRSNAAGTAQADTVRERDHHATLSCLQGKLTTTITARVDSFRRSNDGRAEPATPTNDGHTSSGFGSAPFTATCCNAYASFASIGCANASSNDGF
jgi:hypothetical protein